MADSLSKNIPCFLMCCVKYNGAIIVGEGDRRGRAGCSVIGGGGGGGVRGGEGGGGGLGVVEEEENVELEEEAEGWI